MMKRVVFIMRKPGPGRYSLERMVCSVAAALPHEAEWSIRHCPRAGAQPYDVFVNLMWATQLKADVFHIVGDVQYTALALPGERTVLTVADCNLIRREIGLRKAIFKRLWYEWPIQRCWQATAISDFTASEVTSLVPTEAGKIRTVYVPVSKSFQYQARSFNAIRPVVLQVGTQWNKNLERVAVALRGISCRLRIVGQPTEAQQRALVDNGIDTEVLLGVKDTEMPQVYAQSDMVVFASLYEGFGIPIIEAQATGRPVITGNSSSMPEVAGQGACLVDATDVAALRRSILQVIQDECYRSQLVLQGLENVKRFAPERIAEQYTELYRGIRNLS